MGITEGVSVVAGFIAGISLLNKLKTSLPGSRSPQRVCSETELLSILNKKFINKRIVRNIYEYVNHTRSSWLRKYRYVIHNGTSTGISEHWDLNNGVHTFTLRGVPYNSDFKYPGLSANKAFSCSVESWEMRSKYARNRYLLDFINCSADDGPVTEYFDLIKKLNNPIHYRIFYNYELFVCCEYNNIHIDNDDDREYMIRKLLEL